MDSDFVRSEARETNRQRKLIPILIEVCRIPVEFSGVQYIDLLDWKGSPTHQGWITLLDWLAKVRSGVSLQPAKGMTSSLEVFVSGAPHSNFPQVPAPKREESWVKIKGIKPFARPGFVPGTLRKSELRRLKWDHHDRIWLHSFGERHLRKPSIFEIVESHSFGRASRESILHGGGFNEDIENGFVLEDLLFRPNGANREVWVADRKNIYELYYYGGRWNITKHLPSERHRFPGEVSIKFSPDRSMISCSCSEGVWKDDYFRNGSRWVTIFDRRNQSMLMEFGPLDQRERPTSVRWSGSSEKLLVASVGYGSPIELEIVDLEDKFFSRIEHPEKLYFLAACWHPSRDVIAAISYRDGEYSNMRLQIIEPKEPRILFDFGLEHTSEAASIEWSSDGRYIATAGHDSTINLLDLTTNRMTQIFAGDRGLLAVKFSPDGQRLASAEFPHTNDNTIRIFNPASGEQLMSFSGSGDKTDDFQPYPWTAFGDTQWSPSSKMIATSRGDIIDIHAIVN